MLLVEDIQKGTFHKGFEIDMQCEQLPINVF